MHPVTSLVSSLKTSCIVGSLIAQFLSLEVHQTRIEPDTAASQTIQCEWLVQVSLPYMVAHATLMHFFATAPRERKQL